MSTMKINAVTREGTGKGFARKMRQSGKIPAVLYGKGSEGVKLSLDADEITALLARDGATSSIVTLEIGEGKTSESKNILIREVQRHPYRQYLVHLDLLEIDMEQEISLRVPIEIVGESIGVTLGGILELKRRELEITCQPNNIPDAIVIDITELDIGDVVHVGSITPPEGVTIPSDTNFTLLTVVAATVEEEPEEEELEEVEGEEVEGEEGEEKKEEDSEEAEKE